MNSRFFFNIINHYTSEYETMLDFASTNGIALPEGDYSLVYNSFVKGLVDSGVLSLSNVIYFPFGSPNSRAFATLNVKDPTTFRLLENGTLGFSSLGFSGNGTDAYLDTQWNPSTQGGGLYTQNNCGITVHCSSFTGQADRALFGLRNAAGTAQILSIIRSAAVADATRLILNDNTNDDFATSTQTRGLYNFYRTSSTAKNTIRRNITSNFTRTSVGVPSGNLYLLARNSLSTAAVDLYSSDTISYFRAGASLSFNQRLDEVNLFVRTFLNNQRPLYITRSVPSRKVVYMNEGSTAWDDQTIFGAARYENGGTKFDLYGGSDDSNFSDPIGYSAGAFDFSDPFTGTKDVSNPLIDVASYPALDSIFPMDCLIVGTTVYWFFTCRLSGVITHDTYICTSTTSAPKTFTTLQPIITAGAATHFNHGFRIIRDHPDTTYWYAIYFHRTTSAAAFQANVIRCLRSADLTDDANWSILHTNIIALPANLGATANLSPVYNYCFYDSVNSNYKLLYGRFTPERQADAFGIFATESSDLSTFPVGKEVLSPTGSGSLDPIANIDAGYVSLPYLDTANKLIYYAARRSGASSSYVAMCVRKYREMFPV